MAEASGATKNDPDGVNLAGQVSQYGQQDIEPERPAQSAQKEDGKRRKEDRAYDQKYLSKSGSGACRHGGGAFMGLTVGMKSTHMGLHAGPRGIETADPLIAFIGCQMFKSFSSHMLILALLHIGNRYMFHKESGN